jgi:ABC-2 type transport system permease protein
VESSRPEEPALPVQAPQPLPEETLLPKETLLPGETPPPDIGFDESGGSDGSSVLPGSDETAGSDGSGGSGETGAAIDPAGNGEPEPNPVRMFFSAARKGIVSSQVEEALTNPQVTLDVKPIEGKEQPAARRPSLLDYLVPGYSLMFAFFLMASIAATVIEERQTGALNRLLVAPVPRSRILLGKMIPYFLIAVAQFTVILLASRLIFGITLGNSLLALAVIILASALAVVSLGILIAAFAHSQGQATSLTIVLVLAMAVISGAMFPNISIPGLQALTPHYWALQGFVNTIRGQDVQGVLLPAGVLLTMSAVFFTVGVVRFRFE